MAPLPYNPDAANGIADPIHEILSSVLSTATPPIYNNTTTTILPQTEIRQHTSTTLDNAEAANLAREYEFITIFLLALSLALYILTAVFIGAVLTCWHVQDANSRGPRDKARRRLLWFPVFLLVGLVAAPPVAVWGAVQVLVVGLLFTLKLCCRVEVRRGVGWVFAVPPSWIPGGGPFR